MIELRDRTVLILGLGESGLAMARWCARQGAALRVWDSRAAPPNAAALSELQPAPGLHGGDPLPLLEGCTLVLKSPGLSPRDARIAPLLAAARERGIAVQGELALFVRALAELKAQQGYSPRLLAVTGTNGKTTTVSMLALLAARAGQKVALAGNVGPTMLDTLAAALDAGELPTLWALELSSFQLDGVEGFEPDAAAVLNLTQDHLDWHGDLAAYGAAKARVFGRQARIVINRDDTGLAAHVLPAVTQPEAPAMPAGARARPARPPASRPTRPMLSFGLSTPQAPGDYGLIEEGGIAWLVRALPEDEPASPRRAKAGAAEPVELQLQRLMPADALRVRGRHNAANALAALALATAAGLPLAPMLHGLREYAGEPHRVQWVGAVGGIEAFDDSKGTNVGATVAALEGLGADKAPARLTVILGGDGKGQDFAPLAGPLVRHARAVAFIGRDGAAIEAAVQRALLDAGIAFAHPGALPEAVNWCFEQARAGDAVLLSPACASLDQFRNYAHRAEVFVAAVKERAAALGEVVA